MLIAGPDLTPAPAQRDRENARLQAALASALAELAATRAELASLVVLAARAEEQRAAADARTGELMGEIGRLAQLVAQGNDRIAELLVIAQRKKGSARTATAYPIGGPRSGGAG